MATPQVKDLVLRSPAGSPEVVTFAWPLQVGTGQDKHDNGIDITDTIKFVCEELPGISSAFEEINLNQIDTACYKTMTNLVDRFNKAVDSIVALEKGTSLPTERLNKFAHPSLLRHILQLVYNAAVLDPDKLNNYEPFSPEVYGETSYELVQQMIKHVNVSNDDTFIDLGSGVGQVVLQMAGSFPLKTCIGVEKADTPARYAERMDIYFRQFMAWFGKRYCEYKLLKGDFLVDEHREKITSSSLVFVNNFAFGPNVDHQLKERFADLRDGARIVSSKSFCPLNFRITDRNLSDIGTIMHLSEIPPLKGSVSWTCKPVSYYLHVIDRTILERYFQRLKTQKGAENENVGSTRTTRDRAKREANNHAAMANHNSNSSISNSATTNRTNSPATVNNHTTAITTTSTKTRQQQQQLQQQQQQRQQRSNMEIDTSTESDGDGDAATVNGSNSTGGNGTNGSSGGPTTRKVWSDWCSSKDKSSQSDDEENNNFSSTTNSRIARLTTQKKRKKLTRKAAIASKSAAAAQREAAAREREAAAAAAVAASSANNNSKDTTTKDGVVLSAPTTGAARGRKGRIKKGGGRVKKSIKIIGLDVLHKQTLLSTSVEVMSKKLPAAPGTVDQQLTSLLTGDMSHTELEIPAAPQDTPYALQILLDVFRSQYMAMIDQMKSKSYIQNLKRQIQMEQERKQRIKNRAFQLDKQIKVLIDDSVALLKVRMNELGINVSPSNDLIAKAREIVGRHKELQGIAKKIQSQVSTCELEQKRLLEKQLQHLPEYQNVYGNGKKKLEIHSGAHSHELSESAAHELVLREIANTLSQRKRLYAQVSNIEKEANSLEKLADERRTAAALLAQGTNMTLATTTPAPPPTISPMPATIIVATANQPLQLTTSANKSSSHSKSSRRSRDHRTRSQEWPDVPDVGKIEESNPEVLAQKILETGRQIEAGKFTGGATKQHLQHPQPTQHEEQRRHKHMRSAINETLLYMGPHDSTLMPAPSAGAAAKNHAANAQIAAATSSTSVATKMQQHFGSILPKCEMPGSRKTSVSAGAVASGIASNIQESPKVANFEDRLKSIITSALNEDQEQRKATQQYLQPPAGVHIQTHESSSPAPKRSKHAQHINPPPPNNLSNILNVATQGLTHLNATTTISPITPPPIPHHSAAASAAVGGAYAGTAAHPTTQHYSNSKYKQMPSSASSSSSSTIASAQKYASNSSDPAKYQQHQHHVPTPAPQQAQHLNQMHQLHAQSMYAAAAASSSAADLAAFHHHHRRRSSISAASSYEHYAAAAQQQQQQQAIMLAAAAVAAQHHQPTHSMLPLEFKAPTAADHLQMSTSQSSSQRSSSNSRGELIDACEVVAPRSSSANSDSAVMYFPPTRDRLLSLERSTSRESAVSQQQQPMQPSRPSSNSSQPDYTQVSPAKMALRRHLSQEKLNQQHPSQPVGGTGGLPPVSSKTIGDLVNGEIERTLEISHQSIINAVVNMSTVGSSASVPNMGGMTTFVERGGGGVFGDRDRSNERLLINPNAQRPERVHVRLMDDHLANSFAAIDSASRTLTSGRKSPLTHNLSTLAHVAYNHKNNSVPSHDMSGVGIKMSSSPSSGNSRNNVAVATLNNYNHRDSPASYHHLPSSSSSSSTTSAVATSSSNRGNVTTAKSSSSGSGSRREYQAVALPRAEMKGCIEAYFNEEHQQQQQQQQAQPQQTKSTKERSNARNGRMNGGNPLLEGLAASLQDHVMASRKFKEENEERQRRAAAAAATTDHHYSHQNLSGGATSGTAGHLQQQHHYHATAGTNANAAANNVALNHNGTPVKVEIGIKRTSPLVAQHTRPSKVPHYLHEPTQQHLHQNNASSHHHQQQPQQHHHQHHGHSSSSHTINPYANVNGTAAVHSSTGNLTTPSSSRRSSTSSKMSMEPLLMSPEINSIMGDDPRPLQLSSLQQHQATPIVGGRGAGDDDDVIADDETHWQHRVSSGFDRLVAFASTELDKTRRSIDTDTVPSSISCNTSPDSGITHSSSNSDTARTFLSTSSTSSQMDMIPMVNSCNSHHHHHVSQTSDHLSDSSIKSSHSDATSLAITLKTSSPADASAIESPPLSDIGLPRTPSPNAAVITPPLAAAAIATSANKTNVAGGGGPNTAGEIAVNNNNNNNNTLKIPLKYQRKSKSSSEKHYKKKFCERNWEYDCDELMAYSSSSSTTAADAAGTANGGHPGIGVTLEQAAELKVTATIKSPKVNANVVNNSELGSASGGVVGATTTTTTVCAIAANNEAGNNLLNNNHHHNNHHHSSNSSSSSSSSSHHHSHHHHKASKFRPKGKDWDWSMESGSKSKTSGVTAVEVAATTKN